MNRSIQTHLSVVLGSAIFLAGLLIAFASFKLAYAEAKELQDDMLKQIATLALTNTASPTLPSTTDDFPDSTISDPESRVTITHLPKDPRPTWLKSNLSQGLHTLETDNGKLRVLVHDEKNGQRTMVYLSTDAGDEIALHSALRTLIPLCILLPLLFGLIAWIIRRELTSVVLLAGSLDERKNDDLHPLDEHAIPQEISPFVHAINRLLERVAQLMSQQRRFIADAAHELRSPLTALSLQAQNLRQAETLEQVQQRVIPLQAGIERARQLTEQLLTLARTQTDTNDQHSVDVATLARTLIAEYLPMAEAKHIDLGLEELNTLTLRVSANALRFVIKNGLENALKYTSKNGIVTLRLRSDRNVATIEIIDNGPGIPSAERERVFDAFYRLSDSGEQGNGLGLAIAREASTRLGGTVSLHEREGESGTIFRYQQELC